MRRFAAGVGAVALMAGGMLAMAPAFADTPDNIDPDASGSITVHKHWDEGLDPGQTPDSPVEGVTFTVQEVLHDGASIDLSDAAGWALAEAVFAGTAPSLPTGYTLGTPTSQQTLANGQTTFDVDNIGVYLVTETDSGDNLIQAPADPFWVAVPMPDGEGGWNYAVDAYPKNVPNEFEVSKEAGTDAVMLGDVHTWTISTTVPATDLPYKSLVIADEVGANLTFLAWGEIAVGTTPLDADTHYEINAAGEVEFLAPGLALLGAADVEVTATLTTEVTGLPEDGQINNDATVTINGEEEPGGGETYYGELLLSKHGGAETGPLLDGAEFDLYDVDPATPDAEPIASGVTVDGEISWHVWVGNNATDTKDFWVVETKAPPGHVLPVDPTSGPYSVSAGTVTEAQIVIVNHEPDVPDLPLTGSTGSMMFLLVGLGMVGAGVTIAGVRKARMDR